MDKIAKVEVKYDEKVHFIGQIPTKGLEYSMLSNNYEQINQFVWCKDFMQDVIWAYHNDKKINIYGYQYDPKVDPAPSLKGIKLLVANHEDVEFKNKLFKNMLPFLHDIEDAMRIKTKTYIEEVVNVPNKYAKCGNWVINGSKIWLKCPPMISFYTLALRVGLSHDPNNSFLQTLEEIKEFKKTGYFNRGSSECILVQSSFPAIKKIIQRKGRNFSGVYKKNYTPKKKTDITTIHNQCGLKGYAENKTQKIFPLWEPIN